MQGFFSDLIKIRSLSCSLLPNMSAFSQGISEIHVSDFNQIDFSCKKKKKSDFCLAWKKFNRSEGKRNHPILKFKWSVPKIILLKCNFFPLQMDTSIFWLITFKNGNEYVNSDESLYFTLKGWRRENFLKPEKTWRR